MMQQPNPQAGSVQQTVQAPPQLASVSKPRSRSTMHPGVLKLAVLCWAGLVGVFWITFRVNTNAMFAVVVGTFYALVFFGVPTIMLRMAPKKPGEKPSLAEFLRGRFDTIYGSIPARDAMLQVILVPVALGLGAVAMAIIIHYARIAN